MKLITKAASAALLSTTLISSTAFAGGLDLSGQGISPLFQDGRYIEFSLGALDGDVTGQDARGFQTNDIAPFLFVGSAAYKANINEQLSYAIILDQPFGRDTSYNYTGLFNGTSGDVDTLALTGLLRYKFNENFSVYGGVRGQRASATVRFPVFGNYTLDTGADYSVGYVAGVAVEVPEYAIRASLTYNSKISHEFNARESSLFTRGFDITSQLEVDTPQSVNFDFQFPVTESTLIFGGVRWVDWKSTRVSPNHFGQLATANGASPDLLSYEENTFTYRLGVAQKFNENWTGLLLGAYEAKTNEPAGVFGPTDGFTSLGLGAIYTLDKLKITGVLTYTWAGDSSSPRIGNFDDNSALSGGVKIGYSF